MISLLPHPIDMSPLSPSSLLAILAALSTASVAAGQGAVAAAEIGGGKVEVLYTQTALKGRSAADVPKGTVWRMSAGRAAQLRTSIPLVKKDLFVLPGTYNISARRVSDSRWELLLFTEGTLYQDGVETRTHSLRLDEEETSMEQLTFTVKASRGSIRIKLHWGKHSLNTRFKTLPVDKITGTLGGKPAEFSFYGLPAERRNQAKLSGGQLLDIGSVEQTSSNGIRYSIHAKRQGEGVELLFKNASIAYAKKTIAASEDLRKRLKAFIDRGANDQVETITKRLAELNKAITKLQDLQKRAKMMPAEVTFQGKFEDVPTTAANMKVSGKKTEDGMRLDVSFGRKQAHFDVKNAKFTKQTQKQN